MRMEKKIGLRILESDQGGLVEPVIFVSDMPLCPWRLACNKSVNEVIVPTKKLNFPYSLLTVVIDLIKQPGPGS